MQERLRFYTATHGVNNNATLRVIQKAIDLERAFGNVSRIVFVAHTLNNDGWLERIYGRDGLKKIKKGGVKLDADSNVNAVFTSLKTYSPVDNEILITLGLRSDEILLLEDNYADINAIIALPWLIDDVDKWAQATNAINIDTNTAAASPTYPSCVVIKALEHLTESINMSTGLLHSSDDSLAKTYLKALHSYKYQLNEISIEAYLIKELGWQKEHTDQLINVVSKINTGRSFHGGENTGHKKLIQRWKEECGE